MLPGRDQCISLDRAVAFDQSLPKRSQHRAATMNATRLRGYHLIAKALVHIVDQKPGTPVGHTKDSARL